MLKAPAPEEFVAAGNSADSRCRCRSPVPFYTRCVPGSKTQIRNFRAGRETAATGARICMRNRQGATGHGEAFGQPEAPAERLVDGFL
jgi:hypothetical protein